MRFCHDEERDGSIWVDRGIDDKVDLFAPCNSCFQELEPASLEVVAWREANLCDECETRLEVGQAINEVRESAAVNADVPVGLFHTKDIFLPHFNPITPPDTYYDRPSLSLSPGEPPQ